MIVKKDEQKVEIMTQGGQKLGSILNALLKSAKAGVTLQELEDQAQKMIAKAGGTPSFQTVEGYHWATCLCVNEVVVHGIPTPYELKEGDVLTIDVGLLYKGYHTDTAWTKIIKAQNSTLRKDSGQAPKIQNLGEKEKFLKTGEEALWKAIKEAKPGNHIGDISVAIQKTVEEAGFSIVKSLVGHGVGKKLHEDPHVPGFLRGSLEKTSLLVPGMTIAIEVIYAMGNGSVVYDNDDGWTIATRDRSLSAVYEHTIVITQSGNRVLTKV